MTKMKSVHLPGKDLEENNYALQPYWIKVDHGWSGLVLLKGGANVQVVKYFECCKNISSTKSEEEKNQFYIL